MSWTAEKVKEIVESEPLVVFAKGTKEAPRCGFSARAIDIVKSLGKPFTVVDILADPTIRPALVAFSDFPTSPQLFVKGELVGGSDIVQELYQAGELQRQVYAAFGEEWTDEAAGEAPFEVTPPALEKLKSFRESKDEFVRVDITIMGSERNHALSLETKALPTDLRWTIDGLGFAVDPKIRGEFDKLKIDWVDNNGSQGFAVTDIGDPPKPAVPATVSPDEALALVEDGKDGDGGKVWLVDVREESEWKTGHAAEAILLPMSKFEQQVGEVGFGKDDTILLYCASGGRSGMAVEQLRKQGFRKARNLGGVANWKGELSKD